MCPNGIDLGVIDEVVKEPLGGAHRGQSATIEAVGDTLEGALDELRQDSGAKLREQRRDKFVEMGRKGLG